MTKVVISQPRYLPVISYIQRLYFADVFIIYDIVQRQYLGWENRNKILINKEPKWLTVPISSGRICNVCDSEIANNVKWLDKHIKTIHCNYRGHPFFNNEYLLKYYDKIGEMLNAGEQSFVGIVVKMLNNLCEMFGFKPNIVLASNVADDEILEAGGARKLFLLCKKVNATTYIGGGNAGEYDTKSAFLDSNIKFLQHNPSVLEYRQRDMETFEPYMCFFDTLFNIGLDATQKMITEEQLFI